MSITCNKLYYIVVKLSSFTAESSATDVIGGTQIFHLEICLLNP